MYPFHRKHTASISPGPTRAASSSIQRGCSRTSDKEGNVLRPSTDYHNNFRNHQGSHEMELSHSCLSHDNTSLVDANAGNGSQPRSYPKQHVQKVLREKEDILMSSLRRSPDYEKSDNRERLGPNKLNTFQCLKVDKDPSTNDKNSYFYENNVQIDSKGEASGQSFEATDSYTLCQIPSDQKTTTKNVFNCDNDPSDLKGDTSFHSENDNPISDELKVIKFKNNDEINDCSVVSISLTIDDNVSSLEVDLNGDEIESRDADRVTTKCSDSNDFENKEASVNDKIKITHSDTNSGSSSHDTLVEFVDDKSEDNSPRVEEKKVSFNESFNDIKIIDDKSDEETSGKSSRRVGKKENFLSTIKKKTEKFMNKSECSRLDEEYIVADKNVKLNKRTLSILKKVVLGSENSSIPRQWMGQNFNFNKNRKLRFGLVQNKGGPCGVLSTVQAFILKALLFVPETVAVCVNPLHPTTRELTKALVFALSDVLWQAGQKHTAVFIKYKNEKRETDSSSDEDQFENLVCQRYKSLSSLRLAVEESINQFTSPNGNGCFIFVISAILSAGIKKVMNDMDDQTCPLIGHNGFCSLELVTLLLTGHAVSNVFDNKLHLGSYLLQGVPKRSDIGFLSIHEHFNTCQVGSNLKTPKFPIWVVNSENHFTVVFSENIKLTSDWRAERQFSVYHYDTMQSCAEEVKLTIDTTGLYLKDRVEGEYVPPLELCLRTKWKDAAISWNGTVPY